MNFHKFRQVAAANNAEQYVLNYSLQLAFFVYTHYLVILRETES